MNGVKCQASSVKRPAPSLQFPAPGSLEHLDIWDIKIQDWQRSGKVWECPRKRYFSRLKYEASCSNFLPRYPTTFLPHQSQEAQEGESAIVVSAQPSRTRGGGTCSALQLCYSGLGGGCMYYIHASNGLPTLLTSYIPTQDT